VERLMAMAIRARAIVACLGLVMAIGCGGGVGPAPTAPSGGSTSSTASGATISGVVTGGSSGLTVSVVGANLSAGVDGGNFQIKNVQTGTVQLQFRDASVNAMAAISNVAKDQFIDIRVQVSGTTAAIVNETRSGKVSLCHKEGNGTYHLIDVSTDAEAAHRAHGDGKIGDPVPGDPLKIFDEDCRPAGPGIDIEKVTNGEDADNAPGPSIVVGQPVTWTYTVTNTGTINLTGVAVVDDRGVVVNCSGQTTIAPGASMTCTGTGTATLGQYANVGTATANWTMAPRSGTVTDADASHYLGIAPPPAGDAEPKIEICHRTGAGFYNLISISVNAEPAHRAHGDGKIGEAVPGQPGKTFGPGCRVQ